MVMRRGVLWTLCALTLAFAPAAAAAAKAEALSVSAQVDRQKLEAGTPFNLTLVIHAKGASQVGNVELPDTGTLEVLGNRRSENSTVNMGPSGISYGHTINITLTLLARQPGAYKVGPATIRAGRETAQSQPLTLRVGGSASAAPPPPADDSSSARVSTRVPATPNMLRAGIFAALEADKTHVMLGEQVTLTLRVYSRADISHLDTVRLPKLDGFWTEELDSPSRIAPTMALVDGTRFQSYLLRRLALFPTRAGTVEFAPAEVTVVTGGSFFSAGRRHSLQSLPLTLEVDPLPAQGQPRGFQSGNVGVFEFEARLDHTRAALGQPVTLTLKVRGTGNLRQVAVPRMADTPDWRAYDPTPGEQMDIQNGRFVGFKTLEYLLQPKRVGRLAIVPPPFHYFDTQAGTYRTNVPPPLSVTVTEKPQVQAGMAGAGGRANLLDVQARPLRAHPRLRQRLAPLSVPTVAGVGGGPLLLALLGLVATGLVRRRNALRSADRSVHARQATRALQEAVRSNAGADGVGRALKAYVEARLGNEAAGMTRAELALLATRAGANPHAAQRLCALLDRLDAARYAPAGSVTAEALAEEAVAVVRALDGALGGGP